MRVLAGGDKAKSSGEYGERIVASLLELIGWKEAKDAIKIPCVKNENHKRDTSEKSIQHGADYLYQYKCPLRDSKRHDILISVKCRDGYPVKESTTINKFKEFLTELAYAIECYPASEEYKTKISGTTKRVTSGLIFWIDRGRDDGREYESVIDKISGFYLKEECKYETISLVDNKRVQFIYEIMSFVNNKYGKDNVQFYYISTGLNNASLDRLYTGNVLPFEYINANVIPLAIKENENDILFLAVNEQFDEESLKRLIGLSQELTNTWAAKIVIGFPDYNSFEHSNAVKNAKRVFQDMRLVEKVSVITYKPDFRDGV